MRKPHEDLLYPKRAYPLLCSIAREIRERSDSLEALEARAQELNQLNPAALAPSGVAGEMLTHRREIRAGCRELERLGFPVLATAPLTFAIPFGKKHSRCGLICEPERGARVRPGPRCRPKWAGRGFQWCWKELPHPAPARGADPP
jgi:hypothetical protein